MKGEWPAKNKRMRGMSGVQSCVQSYRQPRSAQAEWLLGGELVIELPPSLTDLAPTSVVKQSAPFLAEVIRRSFCMAARFQVISDSETGALVVDDISVAKAFSILESLHGTLSEIEDEGELLKALWELGSDILNTEELLIDWAMKRWYQCVSTLESSPAGWVTDEAAAPSDTKQIPFAHLLSQSVQYTGETPCQHNGHTLLNGQVCTVQEVAVNKMKLYALGIGAFWTSFQSWSLSGPSE